MLSHELEVSLNLAVNEATRRSHRFVTIEHVLFALLHDKSAVDVIEGCGGNLDTLKDDLENFFTENFKDERLEKGHLPQPTIGFQRIIQRAAQQVQSAGRDKIYGANLLVAIFAESDSFAAYYLQKQEISRLDVITFMSHGTPPALGPGEDEAGAGDESRALPPDGQEGEEGRREKRDPLALYAVDLCDKARDGKIDPVIGRDMEIERAMQVLCRRRKNNPLFVGDAGVGKTAIAEGLALKIVNDEVPDVLKNAKIFALDLGSMVAGSKFRGDFEQRLKGVIHSLKKVDKGILFIDEIHTLVGAGSVGGGAMDASNLLKPALAAGELRCIGSTTFKEYRAHFENDHALARRFQKIDVEEPDVETTVKILNGVKTYYEDFHKVKYSSGALRAAVELSAKHIGDRKLPDKAIDVIDEAAASVALRDDLKDSKKRTIAVDLIQKTVARMARIPESKVSATDRTALGNLEAELKAKVFGQDPAITALSVAIKLSRSGLGEDNKPIGSFLFAGPTGVGKTEVAKQLSQIMGIELIRFDMSEYMERHSVSRLIGAPPGYVGFDQGGLLTDAITKTPHAVLLLDEIEKAHPDMQNILLQVMDHGALTDSNGRRADFRNVIIIMTTNAGARDMTQKAIGFTRELGGLGEQGLPRAIKDLFSPEFRNRLNGIITFQPLPLAVVEQVAQKFIDEINVQLKKKNVTLLPTPATIEWLARKGYDAAYGARPIKRLVEDAVKRPLADELLFGRLQNGGKVVIDVNKDDTLSFDFKSKS